MNKGIATLAATLALTLVGTGALPTAGVIETPQAHAYASGVAPTIATAESRSAAIDANGTVWAWGIGLKGSTQINGGNVPVETMMTGASSLALSYNHFLALKNDGTVWTWGSNGNGELGDGKLVSSSNIPTAVAGLTDFTAVSAGQAHSLALRADGTVWTWGDNEYGQIGDGTKTDRTTPHQVAGLTDIKAIAAGKYYSLALKNDGTVWGWGYNAGSQLGFKNTTSASEVLMPTQAPGLTDVKDLSAGIDHSLALKNDGTVWSFGISHDGALGLGPDTIMSLPAQVPNLTDITDIDAGSMHSLAVKSDGTLWAWGNSFYGQLGEDIAGNRFTPAQHPTLTDVAEASAGHIHNLVKQKDGTLWSFGSNWSGPLGQGRETGVMKTPGKVAEFYRMNMTLTPYADKLLFNMRPTPYVTSFKVWVNNYLHTYASPSILHGPVWPNTLHTIKVEAYNLYGTKVDTAEIKDLKTLNSTVAAGEYHSLAVKSDSTLWAWGYNAYGQLGNNNKIDQSRPVKTGTISTALSPGAGYGLSLFRDKYAKLWTWGQNNYGQLGYAAADPSLAPKATSNPNVKAWDTTYHHVVMIDNYGKVITWGRNDRYQLGTGTNVHTSVPTTLPAPVNARSAAAGFQHSLVADRDGKVYAFGRNDLGQLGLGHTTTTVAPTEIAGLTKVASLAAGSLHSLALKADGTVWAWGYNVNGQLGDGTTETRLNPVQVQGLTDVVAISAGYGHSVALKRDGTVWAWGYNFNGQLGNGTRTHSSVPVQVHNLTDIVELNAGGYHNIAKKADGTYWTWGNNSYGQLGDGTTTYSTEPVQSWSPFSLSVYATSSNTNSIKLSLSSSGASVAKYVIKRDGAVVHQGLFTGFLDSNLSPNTPYAHTVEAYDATGKLLGSKSVVTATLSDTAMIEGVDADPFFKEEIYPLEDVQQPTQEPQQPTKKGGKKQ